MTDLRFSTALQMVLSLATAYEAGSRCTSAELAAGLGANPVLVRKLLVTLGRDGIVASTTGKNGGVRLGRPPEDITLRAVYTSATEEKRLFTPRPDVPARCVISRNIGSFFSALTDEVERSVLETLASKTVSQSLAELQAIDPLQMLKTSGDS